MPASRPLATLDHHLSLAVPQVIHQDVLAQTLRRGVEDPAPVEARHLIDEVDEVRVSLQHKDVDDDALLRATSHLAQRRADGPRAGRVLQKELA